MEEKLNYRELFIEMAGEEKYNELISSIADKVIDEYKIEMSLDRFDKLIQFNVKVVIIVGVSLTAELSKEEIIEKVKQEDKQKYIIEDTIEEFINNNLEYIKIVEEFTKKKANSESNIV